MPVGNNRVSSLVRIDAGGGFLVIAFPPGGGGRGVGMSGREYRRLGLLVRS
jgi:hypothetical protein